MVVSLYSLQIKGYGVGSVALASYLLKGLEIFPDPRTLGVFY